LYHLLVLANDIAAKYFQGSIKIQDSLRMLVQDASAFRVLCNSIAPPRFLLSLLTVDANDERWRVL